MFVARLCAQISPKYVIFNFILILISLHRAPSQKLHPVFTLYRIHPNVLPILDTAACSPFSLLHTPLLFCVPSWCLSAPLLSLMSILPSRLHIAPYPSVTPPPPSPSRGVPYLGASSPPASVTGTVRFRCGQASTFVMPSRRHWPEPGALFAALLLATPGSFVSQVGRTERGIEAGWGGGGRLRD